MADVFLSYASGDRVKAGTIASLLTSAGWSVWWDRDISGGDEWEARLESELERARCVVVLWTRRSIHSDWVVRESRAARARDAYLPVLLEPVIPPAELAEVHSTALTAWVGEERSFELRPFLARLATWLGATAPVVDDAPVAAAAEKLSRVEVAEAVFAYCEARLDFFHHRASRSGADRTVLERMESTYDALGEVLAPVSSDDLHLLLTMNINAFTPWNERSG